MDCPQCGAIWTDDELAMGKCGYVDGDDIEDDDDYDYEARDRAHLE